MAIHPDRQRGSASVLSLTVLVWMLLVLPAALADEPLDEDFLLFLSDWTDESGEFVAPSEVGDSWTEDVLPQQPEVVEREEHSEEGEQDE
ncbi:hypothetical protein [uncultured Microbulbifer sp.]|uniref:hypothetical protein n=1 Tax=uncultured Microbulbifer sp. TaxID=348147 RepID=UPI002636BCFF|nr:hypothetical protein [uncultured Microbulbifer sp.]